ncbi:hypothetical protein K2173_024464 [Erythroxylum novogranatense]|uniref:Phytocyanin domain-containing protein n=1 Tax=Erythroxylum novogranatense TaxID=1862640 RepID=A0AAV8SVE8_9ROSI|nr:hypothetical protein K2173_024464 [Erythroxylum novogranatense]
MARIMGIAFISVMVAGLLGCAVAKTVHVVGDSLGWTVPQGGATVYSNWANGKNFAVGDILTFNFQTAVHDVLQVQKTSFDGCTSTNAIGQVITNGPTNVTLSSSGEHYFICTIGSHCQSGQKLAITVSSGATPPTTTPTPPTITPTAPSPSSGKTPAVCPPESSPSPSTSGPSTPTTPPPGSSASILLASTLVSVSAITMFFML